MTVGQHHGRDPRLRSSNLGAVSTGSCHPPAARMRVRHMWTASLEDAGREGEIVATDFDNFCRAEFPRLVALARALCGPVLADDDPRGYLAHVASSGSTDGCRAGGHRYFEQSNPFLSLSRSGRCPRLRRPCESHTRSVGSRIESDNLGHLDRASSDPGRDVNGTSSRIVCAGARADLPRRVRCVLMSGRQPEVVRGSTRPLSRGAAHPRRLRLRRALTSGSTARASVPRPRPRWRRWPARGRSLRST